MKKLTFIFVLFFTVCLNAQEAYIEQAMQDEMARAKKDLFIKASPKPHFIGYFLYDEESVEISAALGALNHSFKEAAKRVMPDIRVGSNKFDNTGFGYFRHPYTYVSGGYDGVRNGLWRMSDIDYKGMLKQYSQKEGFLKQKNITEYYDDFSKTPRLNVKAKKKNEVFDAARFENLARALSAVGLGYKEFKNFYANITFNDTEKYYLNSEGSSSYQNSINLFIEVTAELQTKDGFEITKTYAKNYASLADAPPDEELLIKARAFAARAALFASAKKAESFIGPVWFAGASARDFFNQTFVKQIINTKPYLYPDVDKDAYAGNFAEKPGLRVISTNIDVSDDPAARQYNNLTLSGHTEMDDEGAASKHVLLTNNGKLTALLTTRSLLKGQKNSNGHGFYTGDRYSRGFRAGITNLFFTPKVTVPEAQMKNKLIEECAKLNLEYCYKAEDHTGAMFKIYVRDGREEQVYGAEITNMDARALRDILHAGSDMTVYNDGWSAIIAPSIIVAEMEITPTQKQSAKKPFVAKPK